MGTQTPLFNLNDPQNKMNRQEGERGLCKEEGVDKSSWEVDV